MRNPIFCAHLELCCWQVDICHHLRAGMLHLQARVQLQEVEAAILAVQIFHGACTHISHHFGKLHCTLGHRKKEYFTASYLCSLCSSTTPTSDFCWHSEASQNLYQAQDLLREKPVAQEF